MRRIRSPAVRQADFARRSDAFPILDAIKKLLWPPGEMLQAWADTVDGWIANGGSVVPIGRRAA